MATGSSARWNDNDMNQTFFELEDAQAAVIRRLLKIPNKKEISVTYGIGLCPIPSRCLVRLYSYPETGQVSVDLKVSYIDLPDVIEHVRLAQIGLGIHQWCREMDTTGTTEQVSRVDHTEAWDGSYFCEAVSTSLNKDRYKAAYKHQA